MFYVIGLGLCDEKDITVRGLEAVKSCSRVYLEAYTSILMVNKDRLVSPSSYPSSLTAHMRARKPSTASSSSLQIATW
jgi:diphthamide biosynthesis methyltransferase